MSAGYLRRMLMALMAATVVVLLWHHYGMNSVLRVDGNSQLEMQSVDDQDSGGKSESLLKRVDGKLVLECTISAAHKWPYCEMAIALEHPPAGLDLSSYETVRLWIHYDGPAPGQQVRFFLRPQTRLGFGDAV